ncbi:MAG: CheR family methyltransferase [Caulobacteraceae bacterium]
MRTDEIDFLAEIMRLRAGLLIDRGKPYVMEQRLSPLARREGFASIREMLLAVRQRADDRLAWGVVEAMAPGETYFFRDRTAFQRLREDVLPPLAAARRGGRLRILSAGCGSGQEAYSIAMAVEDEPALSQVKCEIVGVDMSERALEKAQAGLYTQFEVQRGLPIRLLLEHFDRREDMWVMKSKLKATPHWRRVNLNADLKGLGVFDVIFCRYVISTMEQPAASRLLRQFAGMLPPDGVLVLGADEKAGDFCDAYRPMGEGVYGVKPAERAAA